MKLDPTRQYPKRTRSEALIRFQDCDPLQHLNNAKYFDYYFNAREDQLAHLFGFTYDYSFRKYGTTWVVYNHRIAYLRPARVSEWVLIFSSVVFFDNQTLITEYVMADASGKELKNVLWTTSKYVSVQTGRVTDYQPEMLDYLQQTSLGLIDPGKVSFEDRIREIKEELRAGTYL